MERDFEFSLKENETLRERREFPKVTRGMSCCARADPRSQCADVRLFHKCTHGVVARGRAGAPRSPQEAFITSHYKGAGRFMRLSGL